MLKLLTTISVLTVSLNVNILAKTIEEKLLKFEKNRISRNRQLKLKDIKLFFKKDLKNGWTGYVFNVNVNIKGKDVDAKDIIFSNGEMISPDLINLKTNINFKRLMYPKLTAKYYDEKFLIAGDFNAPHKMVVFSDPLCPNCIDTVPELIKDVNKNPKTIALFYIHMPLDIHPTAKTLTKAMILAHKKNIKDVEYKVYTANFEKDFDAYSQTDEKKVLGFFNKKLNTNFTLDDINSKEIVNELNLGLKLSQDAIIQGTPTVFFDDEIDPLRNKYLKYLK
jgi:hypothetical protein